MTRLQLSRRSLPTVLLALAAMLFAAMPAEAKVRVGLTTKASATGIVATVKVAGAGKAPVRVTLQRKASGKWLVLASATAKRGKATLTWASTLAPGQALRVRVVATRGKKTVGTSASAVAKVAKLAPTPTPVQGPKPKAGNGLIDGIVPGGGGGTPPATGTPDTPLKVASALDPPHLRVAVGGQQACAVNSNYEVRCWPANARFDEVYATKGVGVTGVGSVGVGTSHACALTLRGAWCWGSNAQGQVGADDASSVVLATAPMAGTSTATSLVVGGDLSCVNFQSSPPACWGTSYAKPGSLSTPMTTKPSPIGLGLEWKIDTITATEICARTHAKGTCFGIDGVETPYSHLIDPELRKTASNETSSCRTRVSGVFCSGSAPTSPVLDDYVSGSSSIPNAAGIDEIATNGETYCGVAPQGLAAKCWGAPAQGGPTVWTALAVNGFN